MQHETKYYTSCRGVFQGGGCRAVALAGAFDSAYAAGVRFSEVAGTSAGSIIAALIGAGASPTQLTYATVVKCLNSLAVGKFAIVDSGKSFHAYGMTLLDASGLRDFLSRALLLSPIVDTRYIAHQLRDNQCKLRVAATPRKPTEPRVLGTT